MKLLDIKNNLVKISYSAEEIVALGSFIVISDSGNSYVAQIVNLKAEVTGNFAIAKLILTFNNNGIVDNYDGAIPSLKAELSILDVKDLLGLLPVEKPVILGEIAQQHQIMKLDEAIYEKRLLICAEKFNDINIIVNNAVNQLNKYDEKVVVIDTDYTYTDFEHIRFKRDFKLPLTSRMIDFLYENELEEVEASTKAVIQDILLEVQNYANSVDFIPIESFISVVASQYEETKIPELALLKNKLIKYSENNIFAQKKEEYQQLKTLINEKNVLYIDIAEVSDNLQKELINYIQDTLESFGEFIYSFVKISNRNSDKKTLLKLTNSEKVFTSIICNHAYKYVSEIKNLSENVIFFAPQTMQHDFAPYNTFLSKLNTGEFIIYGDLTQNIPFIVEAANVEDLEDVKPENIVQNTVPAEILQPESVEEELVIQDNDFDTQINDFSNNPFEIIEDIIPEAQTPHEELVENIAKEVDDTFISNKIEEIQPIENLLNDSEDSLTEEDLDFLEDLPTEQNNNNIQIATENMFSENSIEESIKPIENNFSDFNTEPTDDELLSFSETNEPILTEPTEEFIDKPSVEPMEEFTEDTQENYSTESIDELMEEQNTYEQIQEDLPVFPAEEAIESSINLEQGDTVSHPKYGQGIVEKLIKYGNKTLCSISFDNVGRRLLDPTISELQKLS